MGTSKDYNAPRTPEWGKVKRDVSNGGKNPLPVPPPPIAPVPPQPLPPDQPRQPNLLPPDLPPNLRSAVQRMNRTLGNFMRQQYGGGSQGGGGTGSGPTGTNARRTAVRVGSNLGGFFSAVGSSGAQVAAQQFGIANLLGLSAGDIVMALTDAVCGVDATTPDDVDARNAVARLMDETLTGLTPAEVAAALERIPTGNEFTRFIERFLALYVHEQFNRVFYSRLEARVGKDNAAQYLKNGLHCIEWMLRDRTSSLNVQSIDWNASQGEQIISGIMNDVFAIFTGG